MIVKLCGMRDQAALDAAAAAGADMCGFIFAKQSPRALTPERAAVLDSHRLLRVGVFVTDDVALIEETVSAARLDRIQLHGGQSEACARRLRKQFGAERLIRVLWPARYQSREALVQDMMRQAEDAGCFLLDAGTRSGGSGQRIMVPLKGLHAPRPWLLAGGLTPENVEEAIRQHEPDGVDLNSGIESEPSHKVPERIVAALAAVRKIS